MAATSQYSRYEISWRENGEQCAALVSTPGDERPAAVIVVSLSDGMSVLRSRTYAIIYAGAIEAYRPNLLASDHASPFRSFNCFLISKQQKVGEPLSPMSDPPTRLSRGWAFTYQSRAYVEGGDFSHMLVGHGPVIVTDEGEIIESGSLDHDLEALLRR